MWEATLTPFCPAALALTMCPVMPWTALMLSLPSLNPARPTTTSPLTLDDGWYHRHPLCTPLTKPTMGLPATKKKIIVYHTNWANYGRNFQVKDLPAQYISDINYAFFDIRYDEASGFYLPVSSDPWADYEKRYSDPREGVPPMDPVDDGSDMPTPPLPPADASTTSSQQQQQKSQQQPAFFGNFRQLWKLKYVHGVRISIGMSIGGWTFSKHFSDAAVTPESRAAFIDRVLAILMQFPGLFGRVDLDWEHVSPPGKNYGDPGNVVRPDDGVNFGLLLRELRAALDRSNDVHIRAVTLSACATGDPGAMSALPIQAMVETLDTINVMTYDFTSSAWGPTPAGHHTNLMSVPAYATRSVHGAVEAYLASGVPPEKLVIGVALYSRGFNNTDGLGAPSAGVVPDRSWEDGVCDYKSLPRPGAAEHWDPHAAATYSYDPTRRILNSYDSVASVREKCKYVWNRGLRGVIVWESSGDWPVSHERSIIAALFDGLARDPR